MQVEESKEEAKEVVFDPDNDGFNFGFDKAQTLHKNMNMLQYVRKSLIPNNFKLFDQGLDTL